jgi:hypothetical protein
MKGPIPCTSPRSGCSRFPLYEALRPNRHPAGQQIKGNKSRLQPTWISRQDHVCLAARPRLIERQASSSCFLFLRLHLLLLSTKSSFNHGRVRVLRRWCGVPPPPDFGVGRGLPCRRYLFVIGNPVPSCKHITRKVLENHTERLR